MGKKKRRVNPDHIRDRNQPAVENEAMAAHLQELVSPLVDNQMSYYRQLGLRGRILTLPLMVAAVLTLLWRQVPSVRELSRMLAGSSTPLETRSLQVFRGLFG